MIKKNFWYFFGIQLLALHHQTTAYFYTFGRSFNPKWLALLSRCIFSLVLLCLGSTVRAVCYLSYRKANVLYVIFINKNSKMFLFMCNAVQIFTSNTKGEFSNTHACIYNECVQILSNLKKRHKNTIKVVLSSGGCWYFKEGKLIFGQHHKNIYTYILPYVPFQENAPAYCMTEWMNKQSK